MNWKLWLHGLAAAFIGGGAHSIIAGTAVTLVAPQVFNTGSGLIPLLKVVAVVFVAGGIMTAAAYLAQSPVPNNSSSAKPAA